jgi:hypothetical protein
LTQYEPTSQMRRASDGPLFYLQREMSPRQFKAASSQDETRGSKKHDSSRTLFGFRFPAPLRNNSTIHFQKGLDSALGNGSGQASPAFLFRIQQSPSSIRLPKSHASTQPLPSNFSWPLFILPNKNAGRNSKRVMLRSYHTSVTPATGGLR